MILDEQHPEIIEYVNEIKRIMYTNNNLIEEFNKQLKLSNDIIDLYLWLSSMKKQNKLPKEVDESLTNLYGAIR